MSLEELVRILKFVFGGSDIVLPTAENPRILLLVFAVSLLGIAGSLVRHRLFGAAGAAFSLAVILSAAFWFLPGAFRTAGGPTVSVSQFVIYPGQAMIGGSLESAPAAHLSFVACRKLCGSSVACQAFTYDRARGTCFFKGAVTDIYAFADADSGIKKDAGSRAKP